MTHPIEFSNPMEWNWWVSLSILSTWPFSYISYLMGAPCIELLLSEHKQAWVWNEWQCLGRRQVPHKFCAKKRRKIKIHIVMCVDSSSWWQSMQWIWEKSSCKALKEPEDLIPPQKMVVMRGAGVGWRLPSPKLALIHPYLSRGEGEVVRQAIRTSSHT